ncbi:myosuppressin-like [Anthonomus grandis grandis]|uniref:myosuppressin-like n=1 Tax=Anthonomus grandis grandis TaxID=2921223 RepID=UPI0021669768|nr:myosuppressin-like [Anthonomus grandis grandis]XP_050314319.1 myosuppressin-like [Anthonomus grandis grandis]XP_050314320.1 myosuppressin-like [Anthonomus grandis grandis]
MQQSLVCIFFGVSTLVILNSLASASVISCPPNAIQQELNPNVNKLCYFVEQIMQDPSAQMQIPQGSQGDAYVERLVGERNTNMNSKRQDVDHVFLRFGRRLGL